MRREALWRFLAGYIGALVCFAVIIAAIPVVTWGCENKACRGSQNHKTVLRGMELRTSELIPVNKCTSQGSDRLSVHLRGLRFRQSKTYHRRGDLCLTLRTNGYSALQNARDTHLSLKPALGIAGRAGGTIVHANIPKVPGRCGPAISDSNSGHPIGGLSALNFFRVQVNPDIRYEGSLYGSVGLPRSFGLIRDGSVDLLHFAELPEYQGSGDKEKDNSQRLAEPLTTVAALLLLAVGCALSGYGVCKSRDSVGHGVALVCIASLSGACGTFLLLYGAAGWHLILHSPTTPF